MARTGFTLQKDQDSPNSMVGATSKGNVHLRLFNRIHTKNVNHVAILFANHPYNTRI